MNEIEKKVTDLQAGMDTAKKEAAAATEAANAAKKELAEKATELKKATEQIDNLDKSIKDQQAEIDALKAAAPAKRVSWKDSFRQALEAKKDEIAKAFGEKAQKFSVMLELKTDPAAIGTTNVSPNNILGVDFDPAIIGPAGVPNQFIAVLGIRPRRGNKIAWVEATVQSGADYVAELAQNTNRSDASFVEKSRAFGKIATFMTISTEVEDWMQQVFDFCVNEGSKLVDAKIDDQIFNGAGDDANYPNKIYGLKQSGQSTAYSPIISASVLSANAADVLLDAKKKVAMAGFNANVAFVSHAIEAKLLHCKSADGVALYNQYTGMMGGMRIVASDRLGNGEALVMDSNCAEVYGGNSYELEFIRNGAYDAYDVYFRKAAQVKVAAGRKGGIQFISNMDASIALLDAGVVPTLSLSDSTKSIVKGAANAYTITPTVTPEDAVVVWSSSAESVATVDQNGKVTGVTAGTAVIIAQVGAVVKTCIVTVTNS